MKISHHWQFLTSFALSACGVLLLTALARGDRWENRSIGPEARVSHTAVFTGTDVIVWGGGRQSTWLNDGARYEMATDTWYPLSQVNGPSGRWFQGAAWTGREMIIWGGRAAFYSELHNEDGALYDPATDTWRPMSAVGAPTLRAEFATIWTGTEMIIWGGETTGYTGLADGARYNPATDTWTPIAPVALEGRFNASAVWTGSEMIIWGGLKIEDGVWTTFADGARYNPRTDRWTPMNPVDAPSHRAWHTAVWTGEEMLIWGGREMPSDQNLNTGASYDPATDSWKAISLENAPQARFLHAAVWSGTEMIIWGGEIGGDEADTGGRYNPRRERWTATTQDGAPNQRHFWRPDSGVWTGNAMFIYGGIDYPFEQDTTDLYYPITLSPVDAVQGLLEAVEDSGLGRKKKRPLIASLKTAMASFERGSIRSGIQQLMAFQKKVRAQVAGTQPELAAELINAAQQIIDAVKSGN